MGSDVAAWAPAIVSAYDWGSLGHVVDVGGRNGSLMIALLTEHPASRGTVVDLPGTAEAARAALKAAGLADRTDVVAGSLFDPLPPGAGGYLLTAHSRLGRRGGARHPAAVRSAASTHGRVFVVEKIGSDGVSPNTEMDCGCSPTSVDAVLASSPQSPKTPDPRVVAVHAAGAISIIELTAL